jgi:SagB-type dehydrogenase family enzyme
MSESISWLRMTELDDVSAPELAERIASADEEGADIRPRSYPGYPRWPLPRSRPRWLPAFDRVLCARRSERWLATAFPTRRTLGAILQSAHGVADDLYRGPTPSAGGLQALELFLVHWQTAWLPRGAYHYDRSGHHLSQVVPEANEDRWRSLVPSLRQVDGGALLWLVVGDGQRVAAKYGQRSERYLLLEAGHFMQNICLISSSLGLSTVPLGGIMERPVMAELKLPPTDLLLYGGVCGATTL